MHDGTMHYNDREEKDRIICQTANRISQDKFLKKAISSEYLVDRISRTTEIALKVRIQKLRDLLLYRRTREVS